MVEAETEGAETGWHFSEGGNMFFWGLEEFLGGCGEEEV